MLLKRRIYASVWIGRKTKWIIWHFLRDTSRSNSISHSRERLPAYFISKDQFSETDEYEDITCYQPGRRNFEGRDVPPNSNKTHNTGGNNKSHNPEVTSTPLIKSLSSDLIELIPKFDGETKLLNMFLNECDYIHTIYSDNTLA